MSTQVSVRLACQVRTGTLSVELPVGIGEGLDRESVANLDEVMTIREEDPGPQIGVLPQVKETDLAAAVFQAFSLRW
ncbi:phosphoribosylformylglycinamidine synthase [Janibacter sp. HTCC2649]|uniref:hypothetical protein n=1 Tax=Janibacter sp. HTCC2649 TaxID=313589 RepID=UPI000067185A|nr:hypothetical protein [Janibacter sp. HTCC2649]EAP98433.1 phosphoribosylformylglycinamidine synthase [Janibacter sp. HTCC2649]